MMAQAGLPLGLRFSFVAEEDEDTRCVDALGPVVVRPAGTTAASLFERLGEPAVITVEKERVDTDLLTQLQTMTQVAPTSEAIYITQNRLREKTFLRNLNIATADFDSIQSVQHLHSLAVRMGYPLYIKAAEAGYDGYYQWCIKEEAQLQPLALQQPELMAAIDQGITLIAEKHVDYTREVSMIAVRDRNDNIVIYPPMENYHQDGVLIATIAPAPATSKTFHDKGLAQAEAMIKRILRELNYIGVLTLECFDTEQGIIINEIAPRVHNSGHWTIEGAATSQFENHCRAIAGMPLGATAMHGVAGLVNLLGKQGDKAVLTADQTPAVYSPRVYYHHYGKEARARRKLGHVTVCADEMAALKKRLTTIMDYLYPQQYSPWRDDV